MKVIKFFLVFVTLSTGMHADCLPIPGFIQTYHEVYKNNNAAVFIKGIRLADNYHGIRIRVLKNYSSIQLKDTISVWYCNPDQHVECDMVDQQDEFVPDDTLLFILIPSTLSGNIVKCDTCPDQVDTLDIEKPGDYTLPYCHRSIVRCKGDSVTGDIFNWLQDTTLSVVDFEQLITEIKEFNSSVTAVIASPNPTEGNVTISLPAHDRLIFYEVLGPLGTIVKKERLTHIVPDQIVFDLSSHSHGCYFVRLVFNESIITKRIIRN